MKIEADSLGEEQFGKFGEQEEEPVTEQRREYTDIRSDFRERDELVACYASALVLEMKDGTSRGRNVNLTIFFSSMSASKFLLFFPCCFFHFKKPPGLRLVLEVVESN